MEWWQAAILGLVEGITEYLPISSTGHLIITSALLGLDDPATKGAVDAFNIVIQGGAILAVLGLYRKRVVQMLKGLIGKDQAGFRLAMNLFIAFLPAAILGVMFDDWIEARLFFLWPVAGALFVGGIYMILVDRLRMARLREDEKLNPGKEHEFGLEQMNGFQALIIGLLQCIAMWPGVSRSMMTITGGVLVGLRPKQAAEFSFLLGLPTLGGATVFKFYKNITDSAEAGEPNMIELLGWGNLLIGIAVATVSAMLAVRWLVGFLNKHGLAVFGYYRIALCGVLVALALTGIVTF